MEIARAMLGITLPVLALVACLVIVQRTRRHPVALALPLALAALVLHEAVLLTTLSLFRSVTPLGVAAGHLPLLAIGAVVARRSRTSASAELARLLRVTGSRWTLALLPIAALILLSALEYPPNSWDAMTYHLARVAHWIVNESVFAYETWHPRQNTFPPGDAYLLLIPQVIASTDRLAALAQLGAWCIVVLAAPSWARLLGAPRRLAVFAGVIVAAAPMAVLQASSTQYDLIASVAALAAAVAALPLRNPARAGARGGALFGIALAAAWLVKSTAVIAAAPFVAWAAVTSVRRTLRAGVPPRARAAWAGALVIPALAVGLELLRRGTRTLEFGFDLSLYAYPLLGEWGDRAANIARSVSHHLPIAGVMGSISTKLAPLVGPGLGNGAEPLAASEDLAGNPLQAVLFLSAAAFAALAVARGRRVGARALLGIACPAGAWLLLHLLARDNSWISRLELPIFVLGAGALGVLRPRPGSRGREVWVAAAVAAACVLQGAWVAARNPLRPPTLARVDELEARYRAATPFRALDDAALRVAATRGCGRIGSRLAEPEWIKDPWDYPLVWRAHLAGMQVQHVIGTEAWPCVLYTLTEPPRRVEAQPWVWSGDELVFVPGP